ncbi:hypothetical protein [Lachnospira multipara]|nr:hypothetical protein [Lachnospira multipara]
MDRTPSNKKIIDDLITKVKKDDEIGAGVADSIAEMWNRKKYLPVLISGSSGDLNQAFLYGLNEAIKRDKCLEGLAPDTYFSIAIERIEDWKSNYKDTYIAFEKEVAKTGNSINELLADLKMCSSGALEIFKKIYPMVTAGSEFNPMAVSDVLPLYKGICEKLVEEYEYGGMYVVFDEFSKFIESQDGSAAGSNMKLIQDVCELATESKNAPIFFTMVAHKSIKEYGKYLSTDIINSFTGIEGRIVEKFFVTSSKNNYELIRNAIIKNEDELKEIEHVHNVIDEESLGKYHQIPAFKNFPKKEFESIILKGCYPLNPIASYLLLNISEKVAQNERTLFTFISNDEPNSLLRFVANHDSQKEWSVGADLIYDYFAPLFKKDVSNEFIHNVWLSAEYVLDKCDSENKKKVVKALAIILIVNKEDELPATRNYIALSLDVPGCQQIVDELDACELIYKKSATNTYAFKTRAGSELKSEIKRQRELKGDNVNYAKALLKLTGNYYVTPRRYNAQHCMTRYFTNEYMLVEDFLNINDAEALLSNPNGDGKVITLFSFETIKQEQVKKHLTDLNDDRLVVVCPKEKLKIQKQLKDYEIVQELQENSTFTNNNAVLKRELPLLLDDLTANIENVLSLIYEDEDVTKVFRYSIKNEKLIKSNGVEKVVSECCEEVYDETPIINNEMVNRQFVTTGQTKKARLSIIDTILKHNCLDEYGEGFNQEATIYRSLFIKNGLLSGNNDGLHKILDRINAYIDSCCDQKVSFDVLIKELTSKPYGMRLGVIPIFVAHVLAERHEDIVVYFANQEVQLSAEIVVNMCEHAKDYELFVSKEDIEKEKYIKELNERFKISENRNLSSNRIKDIVICMQRWFRALPQATRNLVDIEKYEKDDSIIDQMKSIRKAMQTVEFNPFEMLFVSFPKEFGTTSLIETFEIIDKRVDDFEDYFFKIQNAVVDELFKAWNTRREKDKLYHAIQEWYENQSEAAKHGLYDGRITNFMSCIESLNTHNNEQVALKMAKAVTNVYAENWNSGALDEFIEELIKLKNEIESIKDGDSAGEYTLSFYDKNGDKKTKNYSYASEGTGSVLRNILEDTLDEYDDLSVNDRVAILLEMIDKITR